MLTQPRLSSRSELCPRLHRWLLRAIVRLLHVEIPGGGYAYASPP